MSQKQYGYVPQRSTEDALFDAITYVRDGLHGKKLVALISLDIEGAFDGAWWPGIIREIRQRTTDEWTFRILCSYLEDRRVTVNYLGEKVTLETERGCIQGSIGGPLLWSLLLDPLLRRAEAERAEIQAFADDILVIAKADSTEDLNTQVNDALKLVASWGLDNKMKFSAHKTQAMLITRRLKYDPPAFTLN